MSRRVEALVVAVLLVAWLPAAPVAADTTAGSAQQTAPGQRLGAGADGTGELVTTSRVESDRSQTSLGPDTAGARRAQSVGEPIRADYRLERLPGQVGAVRVHLDVTLPEKVTKFRVWLPSNATDVKLDGFDSTNDAFYQWDEFADGSSLHYTVPVNETAGYGWRSADTANWTLVDADDVDAYVKWWYDAGESPGYVANLSLASGQQGLATDEIAYLGPYETHSVSGPEGRVRLVVPTAARLGPPPAQVAETILTAKERFDVGVAHDRLTAFAAPPPFEAGSGYSPGGDSHEFVFGTEGEGSGYGHVPLHEFVHTQQAYGAAAEMTWLTEGSAEYYEGVLALQQGKVPYEAVRERVRLSSYQRVNLTDYDSWAETRPSAEYEKGSRVVALLDARIQHTTGGTRSFRNVLRRINRLDGTLTYERFKDVVATVAGRSLGDLIDRTVQGSGNATAPDDPFLYTTGPDADPDGDNLTTSDERDADTNPFTTDTDGDSLGDGAELHEHGTDPTETDSDGDSLRDGREIVLGTDPTVADTDGDGLTDDRERELGTDPTSADTDSDNLADGAERSDVGTDPTDADTDSDGLDDAREGELGTDPTETDSDGDGLDDGREVELGTDPTEADTDGDGLDDAREVERGTDPTVAQTPTPTPTPTVTQTSTPGPTATSDAGDSTPTGTETAGGSGPTALPGLLALLALAALASRAS